MRVSLIPLKRSHGHTHHLPVAGPDACPFLLTFQRLPWMDAMQLQPRQEHVIPGALRLTCPR
jgi:hypothetical protein